VNKQQSTVKRAILAKSLDEFYQLIQDANDQINGLIVEGECPDADIDIRVAYQNSFATLAGYATLDGGQCRTINSVREEITRYADDKKRKKPLNVLLHAEPGAGKSHFVECLARSMSSSHAMGFVNANMTSVMSSRDMAVSLDDVRNLKVGDKLPLLFLDEFDSNQGAAYALLLPLLWDGALVIDGRTLRTGKLVMVLAGSSPDIAAAVLESRSMKSASVGVDGDSATVVTRGVGGRGKLVDLVSRINGKDIVIPRLENRRPDKVCMALAMLSARFGSELTSVPWALLKFIGTMQFRHGVRSIGNLVDQISLSSMRDGGLTLADINLPFMSKDEIKSTHLAMHLVDSAGEEGVMSKWRKARECDKVVRFEDKPGFWTRLSKGLIDELPEQKWTSPH
jgi:transcriptional regulator with AAA-type ATPase domain